MTYALTQPIKIDPDAWYQDGTARLLLEMADATLARARRVGDLRYTRRGQRILYRGQWIIDWLEQKPQEVANA